MGHFFLKTFLPPLVYIQNDQRHVDHFEVCMLGYPGTLPPLPPRGARRLPAPPAEPQSLGHPVPPPPTTPKTVAHPSGSHIGWRQPP